jgi:hypothetical protein
MSNCPHYGMSPHGMPTHGNQCALITHAHAPCKMEIRGQEPDEHSCKLLIDATLQAIADATERDQRRR